MPTKNPLPPITTPQPLTQTPPTQALQPIFEEVAKTFASTENLRIVQIDASAQDAAEVAKKYDVEGFPTIVFHKDGKHSAYNGDRSKAKLVKFLRMKTQPRMTRVTEQAEVDAFLKGDEEFLVAVGIYPEDKVALAFEEVATVDDNHRFLLAAPGSPLAKVSLNLVVLFPSSILPIPFLLPFLLLYTPSLVSLLLHSSSIPFTQLKIHKATCC